MQKGEILSGCPVKASIPREFVTGYTRAISAVVPYGIMAEAQSIVANRRPSGLLEGFQIYNHWIVQKKTQGIDLTFGELHETPEEAEANKAKLVAQSINSAWEPTDEERLKGSKGYSQLNADRDAQEWQEKAVVIELQEGQEYSPWGDLVRPRTHGVDDGTHGSIRTKGF